VRWKDRDEAAEQNYTIIQYGTVRTYVSSASLPLSLSYLPSHPSDPCHTSRLPPSQDQTHKSKRAQHPLSQTLQIQVLETTIPKKKKSCDKGKKGGQWWLCVEKLRKRKGKDKKASGQKNE
jgi:hypothetical protein